MTGPDAVTALAARDQLLEIVAKWPALQARLQPAGGNALNGMPRAKSKPLPIDVHVSDLMAEIEDRVARFYGRILTAETTWAPTTSTMPGLLRDVATRYGHFTADEQMGRGFCDDAHEYAEKVRATLERPAPMRFFGPCQGEECEAVLRAPADAIGGTCRECGARWNLDSQREYITAELDTWMMTVREIVSALSLLETPVPIETVKKWTQPTKRNPARLQPVIEGGSRYWLSDARALAEKYKPRSSPAA